MLLVVSGNCIIYSHLHCYVNFTFFKGENKIFLFTRFSLTISSKWEVLSKSLSVDHEQRGLRNEMEIGLIL